MKLATVRLNGTTAVVRIETDRAVVLPFLSVSELLRSGSNWKDQAKGQGGPELDVGALDFAPVVPNPEKIICVGLNYRAHAMEAGAKIPDFPVLFAKYSRSLIGANDPINLPEGSTQVDWEVELGVIIGKEVRDADIAQARDAIGGYTIVNDISMRDWQFRTPQYLQGKTFEASTPVGPYFVTSDDIETPDAFDLSSEVNGVTMQSSNSSDLIFSVAEIVSYISSIITLVPGDLIATGTPSGVGVARNPPIFLKPGDTVNCKVAGLGELQNVCVAREVGANLKIAKSA